MSPRSSDLNLIPLGPFGSGDGIRAALLAGASKMRAVEVPVVV